MNLDPGRPVDPWLTAKILSGLLTLLICLSFASSSGLGPGVKVQPLAFHGSRYSRPSLIDIVDPPARTPPRSVTPPMEGAWVGLHLLSWALVSEGEKRRDDCALALGRLTPEACSAIGLVGARDVLVARASAGPPWGPAWAMTPGGSPW